MKRVMPLILLLACGQGDDGAVTGVALTVAFGSHIPVATLAVDVRWADQSRQSQQEVLPHIGPPAQRQVAVPISLPASAGGVSAQVRVEGRDDEGRPLGQALDTVVVEAGRRAELRLALGAPGAPDDGCITPPCPGDGDNEAVWTEQWQWAALDTTSGAFAEVASVTVRGSDVARLLFYSGVLVSDGTAEVEMQVRLDDVVVDQFGHDLRGAVEAAGAGFLSVEGLPGDGETHQLTIWLRTTATLGRVRDLRLVVAELPPGSQLAQISNDETPERLGRDLELEALGVPDAGTYFVMGKMSFTEAPDGSTARGWLELPNGERRPLDERGVTFSAPRSNLSPFWSTAIVTVPDGGATVRLRGHSGSSGMASLADWDVAQADFRRPLTVSGPTPAGYAVRLTFDHAREVAQRRAASDGSDLVVVYRPADPNGTPQRLHRVLDPGSAWNQSDTTIWFQVQDAITEAEGEGYALYFGGPDAEPLQDPVEIFTFFDDFDGDALDPDRWPLRQGATVEGGRLRVAGAALIASQADLLSEGGTRFEARLRLADAAPTGLTYLAAGAGSTPEAFVGALLTVVEQRHQAQAGTGVEVVRLASPLVDNLYSITVRADQTIRFMQNDLELATLAGPPTTIASWQVGMSNEGVSGAEYDWVRVRPYQTPEPSVTLGELQGEAGARLSRFRFRKLLALRLDAFDDVHVAESGPITRTSGPYEAVADLKVDGAPRERLILQTVRVAGPSDPAARRMGQIRMNDRVLLSTGHRIDRDASELGGYHHIAGLVHVTTTTDAFSLGVGVASPDGVSVEGADGRIVVLDYPEVK